MSASVISVLVVQDLAGTRAYKLDRSIYFIGRSKQSDIQIFDNRASRTHATLVRVMQSSGALTYKLLDGDARTGLPSKNGTQLNDCPIKDQELNNRDCMIFGPQAKAIYFHLDSRFEYDLLSAPERWMREEVNQPQEKETVVVDLINESTALVLAKAEYHAEDPLSDLIVSQGNKFTNTQLPPHQIPKLKLGQFFVRTAKIKNEQLQLALELQAISKKRIGEVLVEKGWVTEEEVKRALINQKIPLGEILIHRKKITAKQLVQALSKQIKTREYLGQILIKEGVISFDELHDSLKEQQLRRNGYWYLK